MKRTLLAIAIGAALTTPAAFAQSSSVQLYGRANLGVDLYSAKGARDQASASTSTGNGLACQPGIAGCTPGQNIDYGQRARVFDNGSRVGLRGTEDLGNGLKAIFQIETGVNIDSGTIGGQSSPGTTASLTGSNNGASTGFWASRDSFVGLDSNWGRLTLGRQSTYWTNGVNAQHSANYVNSEIPWLNGTGTTRVNRATAGAGTVARYSNNVQYTTPTFYGLNATLSYSPSNQEAVQNSTTTSNKTDGFMWGATIRGEWGPIYAQFDYAKNTANSDTVATGFNVGPNTLFKPFWQGYKAGVSWGYMPGSRISFLYNRVNTNNAYGLNMTDRVGQNFYAFNWEQTFGNFQVLAEFGWTDNITGCDIQNPTAVTGNVACDNTKSQGYMLGGRYFMSKRTWVYATWNRVNNQSNQFTDYSGGGITSVGSFATLPYGADPQIWAIGLFHQF